MTKLRSPLFSLGVKNTIGKILTIVRRRGQNIAEVKPEVPDARTLAQLSWRHMYQKAVALWHALSVAEKQDWESQARSRHMTGFAWFMSQALKPNPGLYLPLQGGTMAGTIEMDGHHIHGLPIPSHVQDPLRVFEYNSAIAPFLYNEGTRVYHNAAQTIPDSTTTTLAFNSERYDTDSIHDTVINNSRLTCKTAGKYIIVANLSWGAIAVGSRMCRFDINGVTPIGVITDVNAGPLGNSFAVATIYDLAVTDFIEVKVYQTSGVPLNITSVNNYTPEFAMQRIGA